MSVRRGWNFLMTPGPTNIPERIQAAMNRPALEYAGPEFLDLSLGVHEDIKKLFRTDSEVFIYSANGHGAWEAAISAIRMLDLTSEIKSSLSAESSALLPLANSARSALPVALRYSSIFSS